MNKKKLILACSLAVSMLAMGVATKGGVKQVCAEEKTITYDFTSIEGFSSWGNNYSERKVEYEEATVTFGAASRQTGTITNMPVTKGSPVTYSLTNNAYYISSAKFICKQWGSKAQTITLNTSTDGANFTKTTTTSSDFSLTSSFDSTDVTALKYTFSSSSNQVGIQSLVVTLKSKVDISSKYKVTFDANGGEGTTTSYVENDGKSKVSQPETNPTKNGYNFGGWYTNSECSEGNEFSFDTAITGDTTLYAKWVDLEGTKIANVKTVGTFFRVKGEVVTKQNASIAIIQDDTGGIVLNTTGAFNSISVGNSISVTGKYTINNGAQELTELTSIVVNSSDKVVETTPVNEVTNDNFGKYVELTYLKIASVSSKSPYTVTLEGIENYVIFFSSVTEAGFDTTTMTVGKYIDVKGAITIEDGKLQVIPFSTKLSSMCVVSYDVGESTSVIDSQEVIPGTNITQPNDPEGYTKDGYRYTFDNWYSDSKYENQFNFDSPINSDTTLYAKFNSEIISANEYFCSNVDINANLSFSCYNSSFDDEVKMEQLTKDDIEGTSTAYTDYNFEKNVGDDSVKFAAHLSKNSSNGFQFNDGKKCFIKNTTSTGKRIKSIMFTWKKTYTGTMPVLYADNAKVASTASKKIATLDKPTSSSLSQTINFEANSNYYYFYLDASVVTNVCYLESIEITLEERVVSFHDFSNISMNFRYSFDVSPYVKNNDSGYSESGMLLIKNGSGSDYSGENASSTSLPVGTNVKKFVRPETTKEANSFSVSLSIPNDKLVEAFDTDVLSVGYILVNGKYYYSTPKTYSVESLINGYKNLAGTDADNGSYTDADGNQKFYKVSEMVSELEDFIYSL